MRYTQLNKERDMVKALGLSNEQKNRIDKAFDDALEVLHKNNLQDFSLDEMIHLAAPHILTPEEAFYAGCTAMGYVDYLLRNAEINP